MDYKYPVFFIESHVDTHDSSTITRLALPSHESSTVKKKKYRKILKEQKASMK